jgi:CubicO group peptidase (beta-lactamase class C family)
MVLQVNTWNRRIIVGACASAAALTLFPAAPARAITEWEIGPIAQITLDAEVEPRAVPGVAATLTFKDGINWAGGSGFSDIDHTRAITPQDQMRIGSQTKTYTATVVLELIDRGVLTLNQSLRQLMPDLHVPNDENIKLLNLLDMTAGIPEYLGSGSLHMQGKTVLDEWIVTSGQAKYTPAELVEATNRVPASMRPPYGTMNYSNTNFVILGMIAARYGCFNIDHCTYQSLLKSNVIDPVGLTATAMPIDENFTINGFSNGYGRIVQGRPVTGMDSLGNPDADAYLPFTHVDPSVPDTAGAMLSTAADEQIWITQLAGNKFHLLTPQTQAARLTMTVPGEVSGVPVRYGLGIYYMRSMLDNAEMLGHAGSIPGFTSIATHRVDTETDYTANTATYTLTDDASALSVVWLLDRNVQSALTSAGSCPAKQDDAAAVTCAGVNVRQAPLVQTGPLVVAPSNQFFDTFVPPASSSEAPTIVRVPVPTIASYIKDASAIMLEHSGTLMLNRFAALAMTGNHSIGVDVRTNTGNVTAEGDITATGFDVFGLRDEGQSNRIVVNGHITASAVWWNPDLPMLPSVNMVARADDTSAAIDIAPGTSQGTLTINGVVQTQRIKTAAIRAEAGSGNYTINLDPGGKVIGPIVLAGTGATVSILQNGRALYVAESEQLLNPNGRSAASGGKAARPGTKSTRQKSIAPVAVPLDVVSAACRFGAALGIPGMSETTQSIVARQRAVIERQQEARKAGRFNPDGPVMLTMTGTGNVVDIAGSLVAAIPRESQSDYTGSLIAVRDSGAANRLTVESGGVIIGDVDMRSQNSSLHVDGTIRGNVSVADSAGLSGSGTIIGLVTIGGMPVTHLGLLKIVAPPAGGAGASEQKSGAVPAACLRRA